jgi:hypothetical protein
MREGEREEREERAGVELEEGIGDGDGLALLERDAGVIEEGRVRGGRGWEEMSGGGKQGEKTHVRRGGQTGQVRGVHRRRTGRGGGGQHRAGGQSP